MIGVIRKFKTASPAVKASMALLFANLILKGISLISGPIFTRVMSADQYGIVSTFQSWQSLLTVIVTLNLSQGVFNNGMLEFKENRDQFQFALVVITAVCTGLFFLIFEIFKTPLLNMFEIPPVMVYVMVLYFLFVPAYQFWSGRQRYEYKYKALSIITVCIGLFSLLLGVLFVLNASSENEAIARVCAMEGVNIVVGIFFFMIIAMKAQFKLRIDYCIYALKFNIPLIPHYMSMYILASSDRIMITKMIDTTSTAIYSVAYTVASVIQILWTSIEASLSPWIYERLDVQDEESVRKTSGQIMLTFAVFCLGCTLFAPEIMTILAPDSYKAGIYAIPAIAGGVYFTAVYSLYMRIELFYKKTTFATVASTIAAVSNIILNYIFIKLFGFVAAGYTTMVCYALLALLHYINVKKKKYDDAIDNKKILAISIVVIVVSILISILYSHRLLRYSFILIISLAAFIKRKAIIVVLRKS